MQVHRLTHCVDLVRLWPFFAERLEFVRHHLRFDLPVSIYRKILQHQIKTPSSWVAVVKNDEDEPVNFACAHEVTPIFCTEREYEISMFFHEKENPEATVVLQQAFETFCREHKISRYVIATRRLRRGCIKLVLSPRFKMKAAYTVFKKEVK